MSKAPKQHKHEHYYAGFPKLQQGLAGSWFSNIMQHINQVHHLKSMAHEQQY